MTNITASHGKLTLSPMGPSYGGTGWITGDPAPVPPVFPPSGSSYVGTAPVIPTINGVPQTQQPSLPYGFTAR
jgi:hypothetical protein